MYIKVVEAELKSAIDSAYKRGLAEGKGFNKDDQDLNYRFFYNEGWHDCEADFNLGNEFTDSLKNKSYKEGYSQACKEFAEQGDDFWDEIESNDVEDKEEYCFVKELEKVLNSGSTPNIDSNGSTKEDLDEYNRGYEEAKVGGIDGSERKHSHYFKDVRHLDYVDIYQVCKLFEVDDPSHCTQHSIKKLLMSGKRGAKDKIKDITEARDTLSRYLQIEGYE